MLVGMDASRSDRAWLATRVGPEVKHFLAVRTSVEALLIDQITCLAGHNLLVG